MKELLMPKMGMVMTEGAIVEWMKNPGDPVSKGEVILTIETDKTVREIEADCDGVLLEILYQEGDVVDVGTVIARIDNQATPAREQPAAEEARPATRPDGRKRMSNMRKVIASRMLDSSLTKATVTYHRAMDASALRVLKQKAGVSYTALIAAIAAKALSEFPNFRASLIDDEIEYHEEVNLGVAVSVQDGLIVPVVKKANEKSVAQIAEEIKKLADDAREDKLELDATAGGVFTVSNLGMFEVDYFTPIINQQETAILGIGRMYSMLVKEEGEIVEKPMVNFSLTADHRLIDGAEAARFLTRMQELFFQYTTA